MCRDTSIKNKVLDGCTTPRVTTIAIAWNDETEQRIMDDYRAEIILVCVSPPDYDNTVKPTSDEYG